MSVLGTSTAGTAQQVEIRKMTKQELIPVYQSEMVMRELHGQNPIDFKTWLRISGYGMLFIDYPDGYYTTRF